DSPCRDMSRVQNGTSRIPNDKTWPVVAIRPGRTTAGRPSPARAAFPPSPRRGLIPEPGASGHDNGLGSFFGSEKPLDPLSFPSVLWLDGREGEPPQCLETVT